MIKSMTCERVIIQKLLTDKSQISQILTKKFEPEKFTPLNALIIKAILSHYRKYHEPPAEQTLLTELAQMHDITKIPKVAKLTDYPEPAYYYYTTFLKAKKIESLSSILSELTTLHNDFDQAVTPATIDKCLDSLNSWVTHVRNVYSEETQEISTLKDIREVVKSRYEDLEFDRITGIQPYFAHLRSTIKYYYPGQLTAIIARTGVGKTWATILQSLHFIKNKFRGLYISYEMTREVLAQRIFGVNADLNYREITQGVLSPEHKQQYFNSIDSLDGDACLYIADAGSVTDPHIIPELITRFNVDFVVVDAFYLIQNVPGQKTWEKVAYLTSFFKQTAIEKKVHIILTSQFNRDARGVETANEYAVAFSDSINFNVDFRIELIQSNELKKLKQIDIVLGKGRETKSGDMYRYNWDIENMNFDLIGEVQPKNKKQQNAFKRI